MQSNRVSNDLIKDLADGRVAVFVGAGVSASSKPPSGEALPTWKKFLEDQLHRLDAEDRDVANTRLDVNDYLMAAEIIKESLGKGEWEEIVLEEFSRAIEPSKLQKAILSLDQRIVVTTNFDKALEAASQDFEKSHSRYRVVIQRIQSDIFKAFRNDKRYIIKLHGSVDDEGSLIFSLSDYIEKAYGSVFYSSFFETLALTHTIVFFGFSMEDPAVSHLIERYADRYPECRPHYIFLKRPVSSREKEISKRLRRLYIVDYDPSDGHAELVSMVEEMASKMKEELRSRAAEDFSKLKGGG